MLSTVIAIKGPNKTMAAIFKRFNRLDYIKIETQ